VRSTTLDRVLAPRRVTRMAPDPDLELVVVEVAVVAVVTASLLLPR